MNVFSTFHRHAISRNLALSLLMVLILGQGLLMGGIYVHETQRLAHRQKTWADEAIENLRQVLAVPLWNFDNAQIARIGSGFFGNDQVVDLRIVDADGKMLYSRQRPGMAQGRIHRSQPIVFNGQAIGQVDFSLSAKPFHREIYRIQVFFLLTMLASATVIVVATGLLLRLFIKKPLRIFESAMDRVARGNYENGFKPEHPAELTGIAMRFAGMAADVQRREQQLLALNQGLQDEIVERQRVETKIRDAEARSSALLDALPDMVCQLDGKGRVLECKGATDAIAPPDKLKGKTPAELLPPDVAAGFMAALAQAFSSKRLQIFEYAVAHRKKTAYFESRIVAVSPQVAVAVVRNITERIRGEQQRASLEAQLRQAQKMEAVGTLAGGIAHDFNNILAAIMGYVELARLETAPDTRVAHHLEKMLTACERAKNLVQQILMFSRKREPSREPIALGPVVTDGLNLLRSSISSTVRFHYDAHFTNDTILADATQIQQILINLGTNAAHAMETDGGLLTVEVSELELNDSNVNRWPELGPGRYVKLTVSDTGCGIEPEIMERIFDPYFTTKPQGKGTGLGMALVHGTVKNHGGAIHVNSVRGAGTKVEMLFPQIQAVAKKPHPKSASFPGGNERIFFVDDEPELIELGLGFLTKLGYHVDTASDSVEALQRFRNDPMRYDLIISDLSMPEMAGDRMLSEMLALRPDLPVILCTGYTDRVTEETVKGMGIQAMLYKPLALNELAKQVRFALDARQPTV
jgi:signal transduction histidine kinase/ActR/RegA family two-component response regulator